MPRLTKQIGNIPQQFSNQIGKWFPFCPLLHDNRISDLDIQLEEYRSRQDGWNAGENCAISLMPTNFFVSTLAEFKNNKGNKTKYKLSLQNSKTKNIKKPLTLILVSR